MVFLKRFMDVARRELVKLLVLPKDDNGNLDRTEDGQLICLLEQSTFAFQESTVTDVSEVARAT